MAEERNPRIAAGGESHEDLTNRLGNLAVRLREDLEGNLNPAVVEPILRPLEELLKDTRDLAALDQVHAELEDKIVEPVRRVQARGTRIAILFGIFGVIFGVIGVFGSLYGAYRSNVTQELQRQSGEELELSVTEMEGYVAQLGAQLGRFGEELVAMKISLLAEFKKANPPSAFGESVGSDESLADPLLLQPRRALEAALERGDIPRAQNAAVRIIKGYFAADQKVMAASLLVTTGAAKAGELTVEVWDSHKSDMPPDDAGYLAGIAVEYYIGADIARQGEELVTEIANYVDSHPESTLEDKAYAWNQLGKLMSEYNIEAAKQYELKAVELAPSDPSYHYNLSITQELLGEIDEAIESAENSLDNQGEDKDEDFYSQAIDVYLARLESLDSSETALISETENRLRQLLQELRQVGPGRLRWMIDESERLRSLANE